MARLFLRWLRKFRRDHAIAGIIAAIGIFLIIFPEPIISTSIGIALLAIAALIAWFSDRINHHREYP